MLQGEPGQAGGRALAMRGVVFLACLGAVGWLMLADFRGAFDDSVDVRAELLAVGDGFQVGAEVKYRGKIVGTVDRVEPGTPVRASLSIDPDDAALIPASVLARVLPSTLFGNTYVDLVAPPGDAAGGTLQAGQVVAADTSAETVELQDALNSVSRIIAAASPAQLAKVLGATAKALDGRGEQIGSMTARLEHYLGGVLAHLPALEEDLVLLGDAIAAVDAAAPDLLDAIGRSRITLQTLRDSEETIVALLTTGNHVVEGSAAFLEENAIVIARLIRAGANIIDVVEQHHGRLGPSIVNVGLTLSRWTQIMVGEDALPLEGYLGGLVNDGYTAADCPRYPGLDGRNCRR